MLFILKKIFNIIQMKPFDHFTMFQCNNISLFNDIVSDTLG